MTFCGETFISKLCLQYAYKQQTLHITTVDTFSYHLFHKTPNTTNYGSKDTASSSRHKLVIQPTVTVWECMQHLDSLVNQDSLHWLIYSHSSILTWNWRKRKQRPFRPESVGGWRKDEVQWMSLALAGDRKDIQLQVEVQ